MKTRFIIYLLIFISLNAFTQNSSIRNEIINFSDDNAELISNGRALLFKELKNNNIKKVKEIKDYLLNIQKEGEYMALYSDEYWLVLFWTQEYDELLRSFRNKEDAKDIVENKSNILPPDDLLFKRLKSTSYQSSKIIRKRIKDSNLGDLDKDFLQMFFKYLMLEGKYSKSKQERLNAMTEEFLKAHPNNQYSEFIKENIRLSIEPSKWAFTAEFFSGYGAFTGKLAKDYSSNVPLGVAFDVYYKKINFSFRDYIGFGETNQNISNNDLTWEEGSNIQVFVPEISVGYVLFENKTFKIAPFAGIGSMNIGPPLDETEEYPELEQFNYDFTTTYTVGAAIDIKLAPAKIPMVTHGPEESYWFLRIRYAYCSPQFYKKYDNATGEMHSLTIGVGGFGRKLIPSR